MAKEVDYTKSKTGEPLPTTWEEYRPWIKGKILDAVVEEGNFEGINPNAYGGLRDDLVAWVYRGTNTPTDEEVVEFITTLLSLINLNEYEVVDQNTDQNALYFINEALDIQKRAKARIG